MLMKTYLKTPCPRCNSKTLNEPHKSKTKWYAFCDTCKKNAGVKRYWNEEKQRYEFEIYKVGRNGMGLFLSQRMYLDSWCKGKTAKEMRRYLNAGKKVLDKIDNF